MRNEKRSARREQIEAAAYDLLSQGGYQGATMQAVAQRAGASMETLYRWYGDKHGLFRALVARNADEVRTALEEGLHLGADPLSALKSVGPLLLALLTGDRAVALNRAAASDATGELGAAIAEAGRETILPLLAGLFARHSTAEAGATPEEVADIYVRLLIGDLQIRRVTGCINALHPAEREERAGQALQLTCALFYRPRQP